MAEKKETQNRAQRGARAPSLTLDDVARRAGVSRTSVSYVLNEHGQRNRHVSEETRTKVLQAIQELDFRPHIYARALSKGYSEELIWIVDIDLTPFAMELFTSVQRQASLYGYTPVMYFTQHFSEEERKALYLAIFTRRPIGIIAGHLTFTPDDIALAQKMGVNHIVTIRLREAADEQTCSIVFPSRALGHLAAHHLLERGHRRLALVQPDSKLQEDAFLQRLEGMRAAIIDIPGATLDILPLHLSPSSAHTLVETALLSADRPTGIYGFSDEYAVVLLGALTRAGIRVPQDVALVGTDNVPLSTFVWPSLTTMCFDAIDMGKRVVDMLHLLHLGEPLPEELTRPLVPQLIVRESS